MRNILSTILIISASVAMALATASCTFHVKTDTTPKNIVEQTLKVKPFENIVMKGSLNVVYTQGDSISVRVKGDENLMDKVEIFSDGKTITISNKGISFNQVDDFVRGLKDGFNGQYSIPVVYITSPDLISVSVHGSGSFEAQKTVDTDNMNLELKGSGDITFGDLLCDNLNTSLIGSGDVKVENLRAIRTILNLRGSGDVQVEQFNVDYTEATVLGSGDISITGDNCGTIHATVTGSGDINISGDFREMKKNVYGSGDVNYEK